jgi:hypothetical protein
MSSFLNQGFQDFLETSPQVGFNAFQGQFGRSPNQRRFFESQFAPIHNRFLGVLGQQIMGGGEPTARFASRDPFMPDERSFLEGGFPEQFRGFGDFFGSQPPQFAGRLQGRFSPPTQFFF